MTHRIEVGQEAGLGSASREIAARWCTLAEQRLEHLSEMFETGRWRRYHSELAFLENIQEAKRAVQTWRALANGGDVAEAAASVTSAFGWSPATMPRVFPREQAQTVQPKAVHIEPETSVPVNLEPTLDVLAEIFEAPIAPVAPPEPIVQVAPPARVAPTIRVAPAERSVPAAPVASIASFLQTFSPPADDIVAAPERVVEFTFSLDGIEAKYPLLRNSF